MRISKQFVVSKVNVSNFNVGMVVEKNGLRYIAIQNVAKIISVVAHAQQLRAQLLHYTPINRLSRVSRWISTSESVFQGLSWP